MFRMLLTSWIFPERGMSLETLRAMLLDKCSVIPAGTEYWDKVNYEDQGIHWSAVEELYVGKGEDSIGAGVKWGCFSYRLRQDTGVNPVIIKNIKEATSFASLVKAVDSDLLEIRCKSEGLI